MKRLFIFASAIFFHFSSTFSQEWVSLNGKQQREAVNMTVLQSDALGYKVKVTVNGLYDETVQNEKGTFHSLSLGRVERLLTMGSPALPCINQIIAIPPDATMSVSVEEDEWKDLEIGLVYPAQSQYLEKNDVFHINDTVYQHSFIPSTVKVGKESTWRGIRHAGVSVCPFKYYPQENRLSVLCSYTLKVEFSQKQITSLQKIDSRFGLFANTVYEKKYSGIKTSKSNSENFDYLIIVGTTTNDTIMFYKKLKQFRIWKALKGLKTKVWDISNSSLSSNTIRDSILYKTDKGMSYVMLIGDKDEISLGDTLDHNQEHIYGDYWYGCRPGTDEAEVRIGRFSIATITDFENMVDKTIKYESRNKVCPLTMLIAHKEGANNANSHSFQGCCHAIRTSNYTTPMTFWKAYGAPIIYQGDSATNQDVLDEMRTSHYNIINYRGHGGVNSWGNWNQSGESFTSSEINNMDSTRYSIFFSIACNTGNIASNTGCMLEAFTRSNHGAVAFLGATKESDPGANCDFDMLLFQKLLNEGIYRLGDLIVLSNIQNIQNYILNIEEGGKASDNAFSYLCGGDPTLEIWTATPTRCEATVSFENGYATINTGGNLGNYTLNIVSVNGDLLNSISCSTPTYTFPIPADQFFFSIDKHNYVPYVCYYDRISTDICDVDFSFNAFFEASPIEINNNCYGPVTVEPNNLLHIKNNSEGVYIVTGFKCRKGATLKVE